MHNTVQRSTLHLNHALENDARWRNSYSAVGQQNHKCFTLNAIILLQRVQEPRLCTSMYVYRSRIGNVLYILNKGQIYLRILYTNKHAYQYGY
jgi:hypothetical protein